MMRCIYDALQQSGSRGTGLRICAKKIGFGGT
jgi:hypothetical protein